MIYLLINGGVVVNSIVAEPEFIDVIVKDYEFIVEGSSEAGSPTIGWIYDGKNFTPPEPKPEDPPDTDLRIGGIKFDDAALVALAEKLAPKLRDVTADPIAAKPIEDTINI